MINKEKFKQRFPNHLLKDKRDFELQQFTAEDMIEFAEEVAEKSLIKAYKDHQLRFRIINGRSICDLVEFSIINESNITI